MFSDRKRLLINITFSTLAGVCVPTKFRFTETPSCAIAVMGVLTSRGGVTMPLRRTWWLRWWRPHQLHARIRPLANWHRDV